ncbi:MAG: hypothetical protein QOJ89_7 [bacterium]|jgi:hypothetical protein
MGDSLVTVVSIVAVLAGVVAIVMLVSGRASWSQIGRGGLDTADDDPPSEPLLDEREQEIRQMHDAANARRERRGVRALDLDEELAELLHPAADEGLRDELRAVIEARNRRRERSGLAPLDVESEIERQLRELN